jgi:hypothetical protein
MKNKFKLVESEKCIWQRIIESIPKVWKDELTDPNQITENGD